MHIYFSGIGGTGLASLALIAHEAGYDVSGSDARPSQYLEYLAKHGITNTHVGVDDEFIAKVHAEKPIDWFVYGSAQPIDFPDHPEFTFCKTHGIKMSKRDELINQIIKDKGLKLVAIAGTHGKTTTTAMTVWVFKQLGLPVSYSGGAKLSFGDVAEYNPASKHFIYEADEYDRNFLNFYPEISLVAGFDWDHPDIYPTRESYEAAFHQFFDQSKQVVLWQDDADKLNLKVEDKHRILNPSDPAISSIKLPGLVNRLDAWLVIQGLASELEKTEAELIEIINQFPGVSRRFEKIAENLYSDSAHTPPKIKGALQLAHEVAGDNVIVIYEGLHNLRQHFIKEELRNLFDSTKELYIVPSYLAREDPNLPTLSPADLVNLLSNSTKTKARAAELGSELKSVIQKHTAAGDLVLCLTAGGAGSLDEWLRQEF